MNFCKVGSAIYFLRAVGKGDIRESGRGKMTIADDAVAALQFPPQLLERGDFELSAVVFVDAKVYIGRAEEANQLQGSTSARPLS